MNEIIKSKMKAKNKLCKQYIKNGRFESDFVFIESLVNEINELISNAKNLYYVHLAKILNNPCLQAKTYWLILKTFYNDKKIPLIPPLLIDDKYVTEANIFNKFFADQCTPLKNNSMLTTNQLFMTQETLRSLNFNEGEILKIIRVLNINKAHGYDDISIRMIKICDESLLKPLLDLFKNSLKLSYYPDIWKNSNIIKRMISNYLITTDRFLFYQYLEKYLKK